MGQYSWHQCDRSRQWTTDEIELVQEIADQVGACVAHVNLHHELEESRQQLEEATRLKSEFLTTISHELRTPLNGTIGFLKLILDDMVDEPEEQREFTRRSLPCVFASAQYTTISWILPTSKTNISRWNCQQSNWMNC